MRNKRVCRAAYITIACCAVLAGLTGCANKTALPKERDAQAKAFVGDPSRGAKYRTERMASQSKIVATMEKDAAAKAANAAKLRSR